MVYLEDQETYVVCEVIGTLLEIISGYNRTYLTYNPSYYKSPEPPSTGAQTFHP